MMRRPAGRQSGGREDVRLLLTSTCLVGGRGLGSLHLEDRR